MFQTVLYASSFLILLYLSFISILFIMFCLIQYSTVGHSHGLFSAFAWNLKKVKYVQFRKKVENIENIFEESTWRGLSY